MNQQSANRLIRKLFPERVGDQFGRFAIGDEASTKDAGVKAILAGIKTATSSLPVDFPGGRLPFVGALSVLEDGRGQGRAIVETTQIEIISFGRVPASFARAYGEGDGTLDWFLSNMREWYKRRHQSFSDETAIVCENFRVVLGLTPNGPT